MIRDIKNMKALRRFVFMGFLAFLLGGCANGYQGPISDHFDGQKFFNPGKPLNKNFGAFFKWKMTAERKYWPEYSDLLAYDQPPERVYGDLLRISWVGHATVLIQTQGLNILTDPVWSERASPVTWFGPRRVHPPGIDFGDLPPIDVVLISHNHYDHLDLATLTRLWQGHKPRIIVPLGNERLLAGHDPPIIAEPYDWGNKVMITDDVAVHLEPMHHWSARGLYDRNKALWAAYVITSPGGNIYFVGDSGYGNGDYFRAVREKFHSFRLAILPIGDYEPRWFMVYGHMAPEECIRAFEDLGRPFILPIHHRTFPLADTGYGQPLDDLRRVIAGKDLAEERIVPLSIGKSRMVVTLAD